MSWFNAVLAGAATYFSNRSSQRAAEQANKAATKEDFIWGSRLSAFDKELDRYHEKLDKAEMRRGANEYAKFSSLDKWAPNYQQTFQPDPVPAKPTTGTIERDY
jgi:hypothetical protein